MGIHAEQLEKICAYCEYATVIGNTGACVCSKKGTVRADGRCRHYKQDLLKVKPRLPLLPDDSDTPKWL